MARIQVGIVWSTLLLCWVRTAAAQKDNGSECSCFVTNSTSKDYFLYHRFHDFRNVELSKHQSPIEPDVIPTQGGTSSAGASSSFFTSEPWQNDWVIQTWNNSDSMATNEASVLMINSANNIYIEQENDTSLDYNTYLALRTVRLPGFQSAAEIDSTETKFHHLSARFRARVTGSPGACAGMFTYLGADNSQKVEESDIEILTRGPRDRVQYTNQPSLDRFGDVVAAASVNASNPGGLDWTAWNSYRVDWTPLRVAWYVNGASVANISYHTPRRSLSLLVNMWSDGGDWTGTMAPYDRAYLHLQYIQVVYNTSGPATSSSEKRSVNDDFGVGGGVLDRRGKQHGCEVVCGVDDGGKVGTPVFLYNGSAASSDGVRMLPGVHGSSWQLLLPAAILLLGVGMI